MATAVTILHFERLAIVSLITNSYLYHFDTSIQAPLRIHLSKIIKAKLRSCQIQFGHIYLSYLGFYSKLAIY